MRLGDNTYEDTDLIDLGILNKNEKFKKAGEKYKWVIKCPGTVGDQEDRENRG